MLLDIFDTLSILNDTSGLVCELLLELIGLLSLERINEFLLPLMVFLGKGLTLVLLELTSEFHSFSLTVVIVLVVGSLLLVRVIVKCLAAVKISLLEAILLEVRSLERLQLLLPIGYIKGHMRRILL